VNELRFVYLADDDSAASCQRLIDGQFQFVDIAFNQHYVREKELLKTPACNIPVKWTFALPYDKLSLCTHLRMC